MLLLCCLSLALNAQSLQKIKLDDLYTGRMNAVLDKIAERHPVQFQYDDELLSQIRITDRPMGKPLDTWLTDICGKNKLKWYADPEGIIHVVSKYERVGEENVANSARNTYEGDPERTNFDPVREGDEEQPRFFRQEPTQNSEVEINAFAFEFFGTYRLVLFRLNPEYSTLYDDNGTNSQNLSAPQTNIVNGFGIFTGICSDTLYLEVERP